MMDRKMRKLVNDVAKPKPPKPAFNSLANMAKPKPPMKPMVKKIGLPRKMK